MILEEVATAVLHSPTVQLQLLGPLELTVHREHRTHLLTYDKPRILLALLALAGGEPWSRARLVELLWPNISEAQGKARMRHALHVLRQVFADCPDALVIDTDRLAMPAAAVQVDALAVLADGEAALEDEMCLAIYRGPLLADLRSRIEEGLAEWVEHWDQRLHRRLAHCRQRLVSRWVARNQLRDALRHARRWVEVWPYDEACHRILIDVLARSARHDEARQAYAACKAALASGLGVSPDAQTEELVAGLPISNALCDAGGDDGERPQGRPLAVLAVTLSWRIGSGSDELGAADLEGLDRLSAAIRRHMRQYGAWLAPAGGNQFIAYLGFPNVSETPARRGAALAQALQRLPLPSRLTLCVGMHAGIAPCTRGVRPDNGSLLAQIALALAAQARPGEVLLSPAAVARLPEFEVHSVQRHDQALPLLGPRRPVALPRMHGRADAFAALADAWNTCVESRRNVDLDLYGAPGMGRSVLAASLARRAQQCGGEVVWLQCMQDLSDQPLHPLRLWLLDRLPPAALASPADMAHLLGMPLGECSGLLALLQLGADPVPATMDQDALDAACKVMEHAAHADRALLIVVDDVQWADTLTHQWLAILPRCSFGRPIMLLSTHRTQDVERRRGLHYQLQPLEDAARAGLLAHHCRGSALGKQVLAEIGRQGGGNPALMCMMLDLAVDGQDISRPPALRDRVCALLLELDPDTRRLAYLCALYDAPLSAGQAAALLGRAESHLKPLLQNLRRAGVLRTSSAELLRCNPLIAAAISDLMPQGVAAALSLTIAQHLLELDPPKRRIAAFLHRAGDARAPAWWKAAAADAMQAGALREAAELVERALRSSADIRDEAERERLVFDCQMLRGSIIAATSGPAHPDAASSFGLAAGLRPAGDLSSMVQTLWAKWMTTQNAGAHAEALKLAQQLLQTAMSFQDAGAQAWASYAVAQHYLWRGVGGEAESLLLQAEALLDEVPAPPEPAVGQTSALIPASLALAYGLQGKYEQAFDAIARATVQATRAQAWAVVLLCRLAEARIHYLRGGWQRAGQLADEVVMHARSADELTAWRAVASGYAMLARVLASRDPSALAAMEDALPLIRVGLPVSVDGHLCLLARARIAMGDAHGAEALLDEAEALGSAHGSSSLTSEIHCLRGDARALSGDDFRAQAHWRHARDEAVAMAQRPYVDWAEARLNAVQAAMQP